MRRIIAARACDELRPGDIVNLGIGMPEGIARIAAKRGLLQQVTLTVESGPIGGVGGFVNISQSARRLVFCTTFTSGNLEIVIENNRLRILREGHTRKFVHQIEQLCFHAPRARQRGQKILYITERAVFQSTEEGLELIGLAPGVDLHWDVLSQMDFRPHIRQIKPMPSHVFL